MVLTPADAKRLPGSQAGVAAVEFVLIAALMALMLLGMFVYWRVLQAQQSVTRAAGDGARLVQSLIYGASKDYDVSDPANAKIEAAAKDIVKASLQGSSIPGSPQQNTTVKLTVGTNEAILNVTYCLPPLFGNVCEQAQTLSLNGWALTAPSSLQASATVSFALSAGE